MWALLVDDSQWFVLVKRHMRQLLVYRVDCSASEDYLVFVENKLLLLAIGERVNPRKV